MIFVSACVAFYEPVRRLVDPPRIDHLWALVAAGVIGYVGNEFRLGCDCAVGAGWVVPR